ncbi:MAG: alpha/beta fold hydrolase [Hyphomicrobiales bacterium]|nr:alpha/beta fold hydrolase [Hyphomicrobiales bacterium]
MGWTIKRVTRAAFAAIALTGSAPSCAPLLSAREDDLPKRVVVRTATPVQLAVEDRGAGDPILFLHGLGTSGYAWRKILPEFAKTHRVIALDLKGFGASDKPADDKYSVFDQAEIVAQYIEQENLRDLTIVGHSFGGGVTLALALKAAESRSKRIKQIVLLDTIAYKQTLPIFFRVLNTPGVGALSIHLIPPEVQITEALQIAYHDDKAIPAEAVIEYAQPLYAPEAKEALRKTVQQIIPPNIDEFSARYKTIKTRTLIVWCQYDKIIPISFGRRLAEDIPGSKFEVIRNCGHLPQEEKPEETIRAIRAFLR